MPGVLPTPKPHSTLNKNNSTISMSIYQPTLNGRQLCWGSLIEELPGCFTKSPESTNQHHAYIAAATQEYGLPMSFIQVTSGQDFLPFNSCHYGISPEVAPAGAVDCQGMLALLTSAFGRPSQTDGPSRYQLSTRDGNVTFWAQWNLQGVRARLTLFSGVRHLEGWAYIGWVSLHKDEIADIVAPYLQTVETNELRVADSSGLQTLAKYSPNRIRTTDLYWIVGLDLPPSEARAQRFARFPRAFDTPGYIAHQLQTDQYAVWTHTTLPGTVLLSSNTSTVGIGKNEAHGSVTHTKLKPARGPGGAYLDAFGFMVTERGGGGELDSMLSFIEHELDIQIPRREGYDD